MFCYYYFETFKNIFCNVNVTSKGDECIFRVDFTNELVVVEVHYIGENNSWFAIGFSDYGEQKPADYCVLWSDWHQQVHFQVCIRYSIIQSIRSRLMRYKTVEFVTINRIRGQTSTENYTWTLNKTA